MAQYVTKVRTENGDKQIDYNALANKPTAKSLGAALAEHTHTLESLGAMSSDVEIPSKTSQLENDSGFITTDNNTTYALSKSEDAIVLTGSDGSTTSVTYNDKTYTLNDFGITVTADELNYVDGVTGNIQEQLNNIQNDLDNKVTSEHDHSVEDLTSGVLPIARGGIGSSDGATGLNNLLATGYVVLSTFQKGDEFPADAPDGALFFKRVIT